MSERFDTQVTAHYHLCWCQNNTAARAVLGDPAVTQAPCMSLLVGLSPTRGDALGEGPRLLISCCVRAPGPGHRVGARLPPQNDRVPLTCPSPGSTCPSWREHRRGADKIALRFQKRKQSHLVGGIHSDQRGRGSVSGALTRLVHGWAERRREAAAGGRSVWLVCRGSLGGIRLRNLCKAPWTAD